MKIKGIKGFSLLEVAVVIAIIAIVAGIAVPSFTNYNHKVNFQTAARSMAADINYLRQRAMAESTNYTLNFIDNTTYSYVIPGRPVVIQDVRKFDSGITYISDHPNAAIIIQPRGSLSLGTIILRCRNLPTITITTNITGRVNVTYNH